jgi:retron-type reverse transcriptase
MNGQRQNIQYSLVLEPKGRGETSVGGYPRAEPFVAKPAPESPAVTEQLMEEVCDGENLQSAWKRVRRNQGSPGVDGMTIDDAKIYLREHGPSIRSQLLNGTYQPQPVKRVEIPKPDGGVRKLGVPCVVDRLIQQAVLQVLQEQWDPTFSEHSYGFRPGRSAHQAVAQAQRYVAEGHNVVVDLDLEKFFDRVNHDCLMARVAARISDKRVLKLIRAFLTAGVMEDGLVLPVDEGTPQGGPLSPLLSNLMLDDLDKELTRRGHRFCRYADDVRHITWRWIPFAERRGLEEMTLGPAAYPMVKVKGDSSMPSKRERSEDAYGPVPQGPCDMVRTGLFEPQPPAMQAYIPRHSVSCRGHRDRATKSSSPEPSTRWAMGRRPIQGSGRGTYVALDTSSTKGMWDRPPRREAQGDGAAIVLRGRESRPHGEGRQVSRNSGGEVREMRNAETVLGIIRESDVPHVPRRHPCRTAGTGCFDRGLGRHWKAGCSERRTPGLGRGG